MCLGSQCSILNIRADFLRFTLKIVEHSPYLPLPPATLLWTPWAGASWQPEWLPRGNGIGAIRFYGIPRKHERQWNVTFEDLARWHPTLLGRDIPLLTRAKDYYNTRIAEMRRQVLQTYARETLEHLALTRFDVLRPYAPYQGK